MDRYDDEERKRSEQGADNAGRGWLALVAAAHDGGIEAVHAAVLALSDEDARAALLAGAFIEAERIKRTGAAPQN